MNRQKTRAGIGFPSDLNQGDVPDYLTGKPSNAFRALDSIALLIWAYIMKPLQATDMATNGTWSRFTETRELER